MRKDRRKNILLIFKSECHIFKGNWTWLKDAAIHILTILYVRKVSSALSLHWRHYPKIRTIKRINFYIKYFIFEDVKIK